MTTGCWINWDAISAIGTLLATIVALFLGLSTIIQEKRRRHDQSAVLRHQLCIELAEIKRFLKEVTSSAAHMPDWNKQLESRLGPLKVLWAQAHVLNSIEYKGLNEFMKKLAEVVRNETLVSSMLQENEELHAAVDKASRDLGCV